MRRSLKVLLGGLIIAVAIAAGALIGIRFSGEARKGDGISPITSPQRARTLYHCPMHPSMQSDKPGNCPICGMRLIPVEEAETGAPIAQTEPTTPQPSQTQPSRRKRLIYRSTMNPSEVSDRPGKDSMGMEMVQVEVEAEGEHTVEGLAPIQIPLRKRQLIGVRTTVVTRAPVTRTLKTTGRVTVDERRLHHIHSKVDGWIETLGVNATGEPVRKGQPLLRLYSPELLATQQEFLLALKARRDLHEEDSGDSLKRADELLESSRRRLLLFDMTSGQIQELEKTGQPMQMVTMYSPLTGIVMQRNVTHGEKIDPSMSLLDVADLSVVWVMASVYEYELPFVRVGQKARMTLSYLPGKTYEGRVSLVYPVLDALSRTVQVRVEIPNPRMELKPEMYADVELQSNLGERLTVPESAVLSSGSRDIVFLDRGDGYFDPREVKLGLRLPDSVEILDGLREGESVVTSANFLVDSESKLKSALEAAAASPEPSAPRAPQTQPQTAPSGGRR